MGLAATFNLNLKLFEFEKMYQNQNSWNLKNWSQTHTWRTSKNIWSDKTRTKGSLKKGRTGRHWFRYKPSCTSLGYYPLHSFVDITNMYIMWKLMKLQGLLTSQMCHESQIFHIWLIQHDYVLQLT
jgi:hypothetical protein